MSAIGTFDLDEIRTCDACFSDPRRFAQRCFERTEDGLPKKHPPIGRGRDLFFVNINPRSTGNPAMNWAMKSNANFRQFADNRYEDRVYIPDSEAFYDIHAAICEGIFPGRPFEEVAIVHELYLCASPNKGRLPGSASPCADRYLKPHLLVTAPRLVVTFGDDAAEFFGLQADGSHDTLNLADEYATNILSLPFPRMWSNDLRARVASWVKQCFAAVLNGGAMPNRDFKWPRPGLIESYAVQPLTTEIRTILASRPIVHRARCTIFNSRSRGRS
jgi:hypothetical protein